MEGDKNELEFSSRRRRNSRFQGAACHHRKHHPHRQHPTPAPAHSHQRRSRSPLRTCAAAATHVHA
jgi:hypothetical protein